MEDSTHFYNGIKRQLLARKYKIGAATFYDEISFIEACRKTAPDSRKEFYITLTKTMAGSFTRMSDPEKGEMPSYQELIFKKIYNYCIEKIQEIGKPESLPDHSQLMAALGKYITGINAKEFTNIINNHSITTGTPRAEWIGKPVDAHRFATFIGMKVTTWNKCFTDLKDRSGNPRPLKDGDKEKKEWKDAPINEILRNHLNK